jgi:hypothetical protein
MDKEDLRDLIRDYSQGAGSKIVNQALKQRGMDAGVWGP